MLILGRSFKTSENFTQQIPRNFLQLYVLGNSFMCSEQCDFTATLCVSTESVWWWSDMRGLWRTLHNTSADRQRGIWICEDGIP